MGGPRRFDVLTAGLLVCAAVACSPAADPGDPGPASHSPTTSPTPTLHPELPRGGRRVFPRYRLVGYAGAPGLPTLGRLGTGDVDARLAEIDDRYADAYADGRAVQPVAELIAVMALDRPGDDGLFRARRPASVVDDHLRTVRRHRALLLLNVQPGQGDLLAEVKALHRWLVEPDVGVALDPEWAVGPGQVPGEVFGRTTGVELARVGAYLADLVARHDLPEKVLVVHELAPYIVTAEHRWRDRRGVAMVKSVDGIGAPPDKRKTWTKVLDGTPRFVRPGFKLFFEEDRKHGPLMTPDQVLALRPRPDYVMYE